MAIREHAIYRRLDHPAPDAANLACYLTGSSDACVDTGIVIFGEGTLTISTNAIRELAEVAGFSVNEEALRLEEDNAVLTHQNIALMEEINDLNDQLNAVSLMVARSAAQTIKP